MAELNERIKIARTLAGVSQDYLAKNLGVMQSVITRYEQERRPPDASLKKLAGLTGFPMEWFWLQPITGILTMRPDMPGQVYSRPQVRAKEQALERDWLKFLGILDISKILLLTCGDLGGVVIAYNEDVCIVVLGSHSLNTIQRISTGSVKIETKSITETDFLNCWMQPEYNYLKKVLEYQNRTDLDKFIKTIPDGEFLSNQTRWLVELEILGDTDDNYMPSEERDKTLLKEIELALAEETINVIGSSIKRVTTTIPGAPAGWHFQSLTNAELQ